MNLGPNLVSLKFLQKEIFLFKVLVSHSSQESLKKSCVLKDLELGLRNSKFGKYKLDIKFSFTYVQSLKYKVHRDMGVNKENHSIKIVVNKCPDCV